LSAVTDSDAIESAVTDSDAIESAVTDSDAIESAVTDSDAIESAVTDNDAMESAVTEGTNESAVSEGTRLSAVSDGVESVTTADSASEIIVLEEKLVETAQGFASKCITEKMDQFPLVPIYDVNRFFDHLRVPCTTIAAYAVLMGPQDKLYDEGFVAESRRFMSFKILINHPLLFTIGWPLKLAKEGYFCEVYMGQYRIVCFGCGHQHPSHSFDCLRRRTNESIPFAWQPIPVLMRDDMRVAYPWVLEINLRPFRTQTQACPDPPGFDLH
jgi:hypothetical protein